MVRQNQGFRRDLNLEETTNEVLALSNLGGPNLPNDLRIIQNNLRNVSKIPFNNIDNGFFVFNVNKVISINSIVSTASAIENSTEVEVTLVQEYDIKSPNVIAVSGVTGIGSTVYNGEFVTTSSSDNGLKHKFVVQDVQYSGSASGGDVSGATFTFKPKSEFVFTNDDIVGVSTNVSVGSTTLVPDTEYFICNSNGETQFKLSSTVSTSGINTISITNVSPSSFNFIRKDYVLLENVINLIEPEKLDEDFAFLSDSVNDTFTSIQDSNEIAEFFITKKYKTNEDLTTTDELKFEGSINIEDPAGLNSNLTGLADANSPGVFIGTTRAFSSDNNPWTQVGTALSTSSSEVSLAELLFYDGLNISGISTISDTVVAATAFTHKIPIIVNGETYYLLLDT